ncbi:uncharacterized protein LOC107214140 [Parus major]|uniref:uncharacterized protein LOC107214140 n=1 Tax=Parus major TaxID=9157 RepID=UPI001443E604|nr:uncharacterized protein LOC107214140 [Parus major]
MDIPGSAIPGIIQGRSWLSCSLSTGRFSPAILELLQAKQNSCSFIGSLETEGTCKAAKRNKSRDHGVIWVGRTFRIIQFHLLPTIPACSNLELNTSQHRGRRSIPTIPWKTPHLLINYRALLLLLLPGPAVPAPSLDAAPLQGFLDNPPLLLLPPDPFVRLRFLPTCSLFQPQWIHCLELLGFSHRDCSSTELPVSLPGTWRSQGKHETGKGRKKKKKGKEKVLLQEFGGALMSLDLPSTFQLLIPSLPCFPLHPRPRFGSQGFVWHQGKPARSSRDKADPSQLSPCHPLGFLFQQDSGFIPNQLLLWGNNPQAWENLDINSFWTWTHLLYGSAGKRGHLGPDLGA